MKAAVIMGSDSDWPILKPAVELLKQFGIESEVTVASAHRTPAKVREFVESAPAKGVGVFIVGAGAGFFPIDRVSGVQALPHISPVSWQATRRCRSSACRSMRRRSTAWTHCSRRCRCRRASPWRRWPSTVRRTLPSLLSRCSRLQMMTLRRSSLTTAPIWSPVSRRRLHALRLSSEPRLSGLQAPSSPFDKKMYRQEKRKKQNNHV